MGNIKNFNFNKLDLKLSNSDYWDFYLATDENSGGCDSLLSGSCFVVWYDFNNLAIFPSSAVTASSIYSLVTWTGATNSGYTANTIGLTGIDNGLITFEKLSADTTNQALLSALTGTTLVIPSGDTRLVMNKVTGTTGNVLTVSSSGTWASSAIPNQITSASIGEVINTSPIKTSTTINDNDNSLKETWKYPDDGVELDPITQYFSFPLNPSYYTWCKNNSTYDENIRIVNGLTVINSSGVGNTTLTIETTGREYNPVYYVNSVGQIVNPGPGAIPITGDIEHRYENDQKRRIRLIAPSLLETILRNYEDEL